MESRYETKRSVLERVVGCEDDGEDIQQAERLRWRRSCVSLFGFSNEPNSHKQVVGMTKIRHDKD